MGASFLIDTDVLSAGATSKGQSVPELIEWMDRKSERVYASAVPIAEIEEGIAKSRREGATRRAARLLSALQHWTCAVACRHPRCRAGWAAEYTFELRQFLTGFAAVDPPLARRHTVALSMLCAPVLAGCFRAFGPADCSTTSGAVLPPIAHFRYVAEPTAIVALWAAEGTQKCHRVTLKED